MKKVLTVLFLILALSLTVFALAGCVTTPSGEYNYEIPKKLVVGYDKKFPPMGFVNEETQEHVGFDLDLARAVGQQMGVEIELKAIIWDGKETELSNGSIDLIWNGYTISDERIQQVDFSVPYLRNSQVAVVQAGSSFQTLEDLSGKQLYMQAKSTAVDSYLNYDFLKNNPVDKLEENVTCFTQLENNPNAAIITDKVLADYMLNLPNLRGKFRILEQELEPEKYAVGIRKSDVALRHAINEALVELRANGKLLEIAEKWGLQDALLV